MCAYITSTTGKNDNSSRKENVSVNLKKPIKDATDESHNFHHESDDHYHYFRKYERVTIVLSFVYCLVAICLDSCPIYMSVFPVMIDVPAPPHSGGQARHELPMASFYATLVSTWSGTTAISWILIISVKGKQRKFQ